VVAVNTFECREAAEGQVHGSRRDHGCRRFLCDDHLRLRARRRRCGLRLRLLAPLQLIELALQLLDLLLQRLDVGRGGTAGGLRPSGGSGQHAEGGCNRRRHAGAPPHARETRRKTLQVWVDECH